MTIMQSQQQNNVKNDATTYPQMLQIPKSNFEIPIVLWGSKPIKNKICQISSLPDKKTVLTGSIDGHITLWRTDPDNSSILQARMILFGHKSEITAISTASLNADSKRFVSTSTTGEMCLWDSEEGRCIDNICNPAYIHRKIIPHDMQHQKSTRLFCCGDYAEIVIMDPNDLSIIFSLTSRVEPDWISALSVVRPFEKNDVVIGLSMSGMVKLWSLVDIEKREITNNLNEDESQILSLRNIHSIACSELNKRIMLIISSNCWQIVDLTDLKPLTVSECKVDAINGTIIDTDKVAIGFADSNVVLFQLPRR
uniref:WD_REPEATS_REGION domain-containing protein n=1 Tax=Parastrongyloides trichosuri TaxID=131310 RepID=A0A0N4ZTC2_PARTI